jgi:hypothetical protein
MRYGLSWLHHKRSTLRGHHRMMIHPPLALALEALDALLDCLRVGPAARTVLEERRFPAFDGGCLALNVPPGWREEIFLEAGASTVILRASSRRPAVVRLRLVALTPQQSIDFSIEDMRRDVAESARVAGANAIEVFAGRHGGGFHFSPGSGRGGLVQGQFLARPVIAHFSIEGGQRRALLDLVRSARACATVEG